MYHRGNVSIAASTSPFYRLTTAATKVSSLNAKAHDGFVHVSLGPHELGIETTTGPSMRYGVVFKGFLKNFKKLLWTIFYNFIPGNIKT